MQYLKALGLDIGTTTVSAVVTDTSSGETIEAVTLANDAAFKTQRPFERVQSAEKIIEKAVSLVDTLIDKHGADAIGVTGQMHGIVYLDSVGKLLSPLYTWQDESGNQPFHDSGSYAAVLERRTGYKAAAGFGCTTYFYHAQNGLVPQDASVFCTIHDLAAMTLAGRNSPLVHSSDAASFGIFNIKNNCFDLDAAASAELDVSLFPEVTGDICIVGEHRGIPVSCAIGDNQASFFGSVEDVNTTVLVNMGTGGQISFVSQLEQAPPGTEIRPLDRGVRLLVGSSLCGGRAFALLEEFFRKTAETVTGQSVGSAYPAMDAILAGENEPENPLSFSTLFCGTRDDPWKRACITGIGLDNFTPEHFLYAVLDGMVDELYSMYTAAGAGSVKRLAGSGNALRKNMALQRRFEQRFGAELKIPAHKEEAAHGAAAAVAKVLGK